MSTTNVDLLKVLVSDANVAASERQRWFGVSYAEDRAKLSSTACNAVVELIEAATHAERKLAAYVGVCGGDKELTDAVLPHLRSALARVGAP